MDRPALSAGTRLLVAGLVLVSLSACSGTPVTGAPVDEGCVSPPAAALDEQSAVVLIITPNPVSSGSEAVLSVSSEGLPADALNGIAALWQCWNGYGWVSTHALFRGVGPCQDPAGPATCGEPSVRDVGGPQLAMGLGVPNAYPILVPDVPAGIYRIQDTVVLPDPLGPPPHVTGFVIVWVR